jgi:hypothetical protein
MCPAELHYCAYGCKIYVKQSIGYSCASYTMGTAGLRRDGPCAETRFRLSEERTSPFESAGVSA